MSELSESDRLTITVNNRPIEVFGGLTILQALHKEGIEVPPSATTSGTGHGATVLSGRPHGANV